MTSLKAALPTFWPQVDLGTTLVYWLSPDHLRLLTSRRQIPSKSHQFPNWKCVMWTHDQANSIRVLALAKVTYP